MNLAVCLKRVPDSTTKLKIGPDGKSIDPQGVEWAISPYDELAIEREEIEEPNEGPISATYERKGNRMFIEYSTGQKEQIDLEVLRMSKFRAKSEEMAVRAEAATLQVQTRANELAKQRIVMANKLQQIIEGRVIDEQRSLQVEKIRLSLQPNHVLPVNPPAYI